MLEVAYLAAARQVSTSEQPLNLSRVGGTVNNQERQLDVDSE